MLLTKIKQPSTILILSLILTISICDQSQNPANTPSAPSTPVAPIAPNPQRPENPTNPPGQLRAYAQTNKPNSYYSQNPPNSPIPPTHQQNNFAQQSSFNQPNRPNWPDWPDWMDRPSRPNRPIGPIGPIGPIRPGRPTSPRGPNRFKRSGNFNYWNLENDDFPLQLPIPPVPPVSPVIDLSNLNRQLKNLGSNLKDLESNLEQMRLNQQNMRKKRQEQLKKLNLTQGRRGNVAFSPGISVTTYSGSGEGYGRNSLLYMEIGGSVSIISIGNIRRQIYAPQGTIGRAQVAGGVSSFSPSNGAKLYIDQNAVYLNGYLVQPRRLKDEKGEQYQLYQFQQATKTSYKLVGDETIYETKRIPTISESYETGAWVDGKPVLNIKVIDKNGDEHIFSSQRKFSNGNYYTVQDDKYQYYEKNQPIDIDLLLGAAKTTPENQNIPKQVNN